MATRKKKKTEAEQFDSQVVMKEEFYDLEPKVVVGSHLTVTTYPDGRTELKWDDDALLRDVRDAILRHESNIPATAEALSIRKRKTIKERSNDK
jgi:hypothetical protein